MRKLFIVLSLLTVPVISWLFFFNQQPKAVALPVTGTVPAFSLTDTDQKAFTLTNLQNKVWVVNFMFTTCSGICPVMTRNLVPVYDYFRNDSGVMLVSISVNPENDSPDVLKKYAERYALDTNKWQFLTGERAEIERLAIHGFKVGTVEEPVFHSNYFILVDRKGQIRGYYDGTDKKKVKELKSAIAVLLKEGA